MFNFIKKRYKYYIFVIFLLWPVMTVLMATRDTLGLPYYDATITQALIFSLCGMLISAADLFVIGGICFVSSIMFFSWLERVKFIRASDSPLACLVELFLCFVAALYGAALYYPAVLSQPAFLNLRNLPVYLLTAFLALVVTFLCAYLAAPSRKATMIITMLIIGALIPVPGLWRNNIAPAPPSTPPVVLLGIDSLSLQDPLIPLQEWVEANHGTWYKRAVTPGLLTNAVWTSILLAKPASEHGIFHIWQNGSDQASSSILKEARRRNYFTISVFSNQLTCWAGSSFSFDHSESGPVGWRQLASSLFENASILLPLAKPALPRIPFSASPPNHSGSYSYSIDRQLLEIFSWTSEVATPLIFAHVNYLHEQVYPTYLDLTWDERKKVLFSPAHAVKDRSFDWQDKDLPTDTLQLRRWKINHLQKAVVSAIETTGFLERNGKLVLFSDHGNRTDLTAQNFMESRFHNVPLVTFNLPPRDKDSLISTIDSGSILGLTGKEPHAPVVEFSHIEPHEWPSLFESAKFSWDGLIQLDEKSLAKIYSRLESHHPYAASN